jgi:hypothetical protein
MNQCSPPSASKTHISVSPLSLWTVLLENFVSGIFSYKKDEITGKDI